MIENEMLSTVFDKKLFSCSKIEKMPFGININTKRFEDQKMFNIALTLENIFKFNKENR